MTDDTAFRETRGLAGWLCQWICEEIWGHCCPLHLDGQDFRPASDEEFADLGYPEDENTVLLLRRESDGAFFEVELDADVRRMRPGDYEARLKRLAGLRDMFPTATEATP